MMFFINGSFIEDTKATISPLDLGLLRGYSAFEFIRTYGKDPFYLKEHLERFFFSTKALSLPLTFSREELKKIVLELIKKDGRVNLGIKLFATGGVSEDQFLPQGSPFFFAFTTPLTSYSEECFSKGISVITIPASRSLSTAKTSLYLPAIAALKKEPYAKEAFYISAGGGLLEATTSNVFVVKDKTLFTSQSSEVLFGITREVVLHLAKDFPIDLTDYPFENLMDADEIFITATNKEIMPVTAINKSPIKNGVVGPVTVELMMRFQRFVKEKVWPDLPIGRHHGQEKLKIPTYTLVPHSL